MDEAAIEELMAQDGFRELAAAHEELLAEPPEAAMARLVGLARLALENALSVDWDVGAALFVLREHKRGRDAAETVAKGVIERLAGRFAEPGRVRGVEAGLASTGEHRCHGPTPPICASACCWPASAARAAKPGSPAASG